MILYIVRHAWAADRGDPRWPDDTRRPLTGKGKERFSRVACQLADRRFQPQVVAASPYTRCRQTADILADMVADRPQVVTLNDLAPGGDLGALVAWTAAQAAHFQRIAWVGHAPDVGRMAAALIGSGDSHIHFAKGAVAAIEFGERVVTGGGDLQWLVTPELLGC